MSERGPGRPTKRTREIEISLETALSLGATIDQACFQADIHPSTFHRWGEADEAFRDRMTALRETQVLVALTTVSEALASDVKTAQWYLERRHPDFKPKSAVEQTGAVSITHVESEYVAP